MDIIAADAECILKKVDLAELRGKKVLVTGASGLIGGYFLACLSRFTQRDPGAIDVTAVMQAAPPAHLSAYLKGVRVLRGDMSDDAFLGGLPPADYMIHAAGYAQPGLFVKNPVKTLRLNTTGTCALLDKLRPKGKFMFVSSSEVYSGLPDLPYKETDIGRSNTTHPRACYIEAKRCGEAICNAYRTKGVDAKSVRLSLTYGPGTKRGDTRVINEFIRKAFDGKITLLDRGEDNRTYCYVSDAVAYMWDILLKGRDPIYNVGGISPVTIGELAREIGGLVNVPVAFPGTAAGMPGAPGDVSLDMTKVHREFGARKYVPLREGLARTIAWQKENLQDTVKSRSKK